MKPRRVLSAFTVVLLLACCDYVLCQTPPSDFACKYIANGSDIKTLKGGLTQVLPDGRMLLGGFLDLAGSRKSVQWIASAAADGRVLWAARAEGRPDRISDSPCASDGDSIWHAGLFNSGAVRLARFEGKTLRRQASLEMAFEPSAGFDESVLFHRPDNGDFDLEISVLQPVRDSFHLAVLSRDLRILFDKVYQIPIHPSEAVPEAFQDAFVTRLVDRSGYYVFPRHPIRPNAQARPGVGVIRLGNDGTVKWANSYAFGSSDFDLEPRTTDDGSVLVHDALPGLPSKGCLMIKIGPDGALNWATAVEGMGGGFGHNTAGWVPYRFTKPYLLARVFSPNERNYSSVFLGLNYETGKLEKQVKIGTPGLTEFVGQTADYFYAAFLTMPLNLLHPVYHAAVLKFDYDMKLLAARRIHEAGPNSPVFRFVPPDSGFISYHHDSKRSLIVESTNANLESPDPCRWLDKDSFTVAISKLRQRPLQVTTTALDRIRVTDANSKTSEADLSLVPLDLKSVPCNPAEGKAERSKIGSSRSSAGVRLAVCDRQ